MQSQEKSWGTQHGADWGWGNGGGGKEWAKLAGGMKHATRSQSVSRLGYRLLHDCLNAALADVIGKHGTDGGGKHREGGGG